MPCTPAPKRKNRASSARAAKRAKTERDEEFEAFLKKDWQYWWRFESPEEEDRFQRRLDEANREFLAEWPHDSQPLGEHYGEVEKKVYKEIVCHRKK